MTRVPTAATPYAYVESLFSKSLKLNRRPVAVAFRSEAPADVPRFDGSVPSTCSFWRLAAERPPFYTVQSDHYNCPVGSYTHNIPLPPARVPELEQTLGLMTELGYLRMEEVPGIPRLPRTPEVIVYGALGDMPVEADAVVITGRPGQLMLLHEAALRAGMDASTPFLGRPTCMAIPAALSQTMTASLGCIGNRVYTDVAEDEFYVIVSAHRVETIAEQLATIVSANKALADHHRSRLALLDG